METNALFWLLQAKMNYLRRRFSSSDIQKDLEDEDSKQQNFGNAASNFFGFGAGKKGKVLSWLLGLNNLTFLAT